MTSSLLRSTLLAMLLASFHCAHAQSQTPASPGPLPSGPAPAPLVLPKPSAVPLFSSKPQDIPPPTPLADEDDNFCTTPSNTGYRTSKPVSEDGKKATSLYLWSVKKQIWSNWKAPREVNDPWLKAAVVRVRFEILADGSLNDPVVMMTSGRASYDRRALESIKLSAPFGRPPANGPTPIKVCFSFGYNTTRENQNAMPVDVFAKKPAAQ
jgi:TonB family protein